MIFVVYYSHRHGCDVFAFEDEADATRFGADLALEYTKELSHEADRARVRELYAAGQFQECTEHYELHAGDESITVHPVELRRK
jgi:hypothetical protein